MRITTDTGENIQFDPAFNVIVERRQSTGNAGDNYSILDENPIFIKMEAVTTLYGKRWFPASQIEEVRSRLAARGLGLLIVEE